jgi:nucleoside-diphosphate-sugar epimerase
MSFNSDPDKVITPVLKGISSLLKAAQGQKSIRRFILTSSSLALGSPNPGGKVTQHFDSTSWNDKSVESMKQSSNPINVYASSKVLSEKYAWNFIKTEKPHFILNAILPNANLGAGVPGVLPLLTTGKWIPELAETGYCWALDIGSQYHIDVFDCAKLHIKALMVQDVQNERILAFGTRYSVNDLIDAVKSVRPDAPTPQRKDEWDILDNTTVDVKRANQLLESQGGLRDLEYSVRASLQD